MGLVERSSTLKILHVISSPAAGGAEVYVKDLAKELATNGHDVHIGFLESAVESGRSSVFQELFLRELDDAGIRYFFVGRVARRMPLLGVFRVRSYVRKNEIEVYHSHLIYGAAFGALIKVPRVYTHHSVEMRRSRILFFIVSRFIDHFVGISKACTNTLSAHSRRSVTTIFNGVDEKRILIGELKPRQIDEEIRCISIGRICEDKNYALLVNAISRLPLDIRKRLSVEIAGEGSVADTNYLSAKIGAACIEDTVRLLGVRNDIPELLARSHLFLMSSASEGLPVALIEAAMSGLPCVVTDVGGCSEVIDVCQNGIVVAPNDEQALADAISRMVCEASLLSTFSANALRLASSFSIDRAYSGHVRLYRELLQIDQSVMNASNSK